MLEDEAAEAEEIADAEERGERESKPGQRPRSPQGASQVYSLRLPADAISQLRAMAERMDEAPTALLRRFVLERLADEARRVEPVDAVAAAVDGLLPLVRQRLLEAARGASEPENAMIASALLSPRSGINLGPSRRRPGAAVKGRREMLA
jgi:hypothetical protein